jgi:hypothetical protein
MLPREIEKYEESGLLLIPCKQDKHPAYKGWQQIASSERSKHKEWFEANHFNVGLLTGERNGIVVIDFDDLEMARSFYHEFRAKIKTIMQTPRPGIHFVFKHPGEIVRNAVKARIGDLLADVRGDGGFILAPPSETYGPYRFVEGFDLDPKQLEVFDPKWIERKEVKREPIHEDDTLRRITRARAWLAKHEPAISGQGGHKQMFSACCRMFQRFQLTIEQAWPLILEYSERCVPPFSEKELRHKILDASQKPITQ